MFPFVNVENVNIDSNLVTNSFITETDKKLYFITFIGTIISLSFHSFPKREILFLCPLFSWQNKSYPHFSLSKIDKSTWAIQQCLTHSYNCRLAAVAPNWALAGDTMATQSMCFSVWASHLANPKVTSSESTPDPPWGHALPRVVCMALPEGVEQHVRTRDTHQVSGTASLNPELHGLQCLSSPITLHWFHTWHYLIDIRAKASQLNVTPIITSFTSHQITNTDQRTNNRMDTGARCLGSNSAYNMLSCDLEQVS